MLIGGRLLSSLFFIENLSVLRMINKIFPDMVDIDRLFGKTKIFIR